MNKTLSDTVTEIIWLDCFVGWLRHQVETLINITKQLFKYEGIIAEHISETQSVHMDVSIYRKTIFSNMPSNFFLSWILSEFWYYLIMFDNVHDRVSSAMLHIWNSIVVIKLTQSKNGMREVLEMCSSITILIKCADTEMRSK